MLKKQIQSNRTFGIGFLHCETIFEKFLGTFVYIGTLYRFILVIIQNPSFGNYEV